MRTQLSSLSFIVSGLLISAVASAKPMTVKDWSLDDSGAVCVASTTRTVSGQTYRFELSLDKAGIYPVEAWVREVPSTGSTQAFRFTTEVAPTINYAFVPVQDASGNVTFWQVPTDTNSLISYIKRQTRLLIQGLTPNGASLPISKPVDFSLRGSSDIVDALSKCNGGKGLVQSDFEKSFVPAQIATLDPLKIDATKAAQLRSLYQSSVVAQAQKITLQQQLTALNTQYAKQIQDLAKVSGTLDDLTQRQLTALQAQKTSIENRIKDIDQQLSDQQAAIDAKEAQVVTANAAYDQAWKVIAPYEPEHKRLSDVVQTASNNLAANQAQLNSIDQGIQSKTNQINNLNNEVNSLRNQLDQVNSQIRQARMDMDYTDQNYRRFDSYRERDERISCHPLTRYCQYSHAQACDRLMSRVFNEADSEVSKIQNRLSDNVNSARAIYQQKNDYANQLDARIRNDLNYEIPNLQNQISSLQSQRPAAATAVAQASSDLSTKAAALQSYDQSVGYATKKADLNAKASIVVQLQNDLTSLEQAKAATQATRDQKVRELAATDKGIQDVLAKIQATQDRESELTKALQPYFAEKSRIEAAIADSDSRIQKNKQDFAAIIIG